MARRTDTPFDEPKKLWERLTYPSLKWAFEEGHKIGYAEGYSEGHGQGVGTGERIIWSQWPPPYRPDPQAFDTVTNMAKRGIH